MTRPDEPSLPRATSVAAHRAILDDGTISGQQKRIYGCLFGQGPMTATECIRWINSHPSFSGLISEQTHTRFAELRRRGVIREVGKKVCAHTKKRCIAWDVTSSMPLPPEKSEAKRLDVVPGVAVTKELAGVVGPTPAQFAAALNELRSLRTLAAMHGRGFSEDLLRVCEWVHGKGNE